MLAACVGAQRSLGVLASGVGAEGCRSVLAACMGAQGSLGVLVARLCGHVCVQSLCGCRRVLVACRGAQRSLRVLAACSPEPAWIYGSA